MMQQRGVEMACYRMFRSLIESYFDRYLVAFGRKKTVHIRLKAEFVPLLNAWLSHGGAQYVPWRDGASEETIETFTDR